MAMSGPERFQLVLLRRMADFRPELVERARDALGVSATDMREVNAHWQRFVRSRTSPRGAGRYTAVLGRPESVDERVHGAITLRLHRWPLPLWPGLRFEVVEGPGATVLEQWLVHAPDASPPTAARGADLTAWGFVVTDLERLFTGVRHLPPDAPTRWTSEFTAPDGRWRARFVYGLLQATEAA
jgi:hypothetical protein